MSAFNLHPLLEAHLKTGRIAHAYVFTGATDPSKEALVMAFAKALNCDEMATRRGIIPGLAADEKDSMNGIASCLPAGRRPLPGLAMTCACVSCRKMENHSHPDLRWLGDDPKARSLKIEEVRSLIHQASLKPFEGRWKVFVLQGAERLTLEAANALLKVLEEPPKWTVFLLLAETKAHLLETVQSRCYEIRTSALPEKDPLENPLIRFLDQKGKEIFFEKLKGLSREELEQNLEDLMRYLRDQAARAWWQDPTISKRWVDTFESVYKTQGALGANVNQKLAVTYLEIEWQKVWND